MCVSHLLVPQSAVPDTSIRTLLPLSRHTAVANHTIGTCQQHKFPVLFIARSSVLRYKLVRVLWTRGHPTLVYRIRGTHSERLFDFGGLYMANPMSCILRILSLFGVSVTNNNGFWIRLLELVALLYNYNQLTAHTLNSFWTTSVWRIPVKNLSNSWMELPFYNCERTE
jgi:hypothetical protein